MSKKNTYTYFQGFIKDKDKAVNHFIENMLARTQSMFKYEGLPDTIPQSELERILQTSGNIFVTKVDGKLYALNGGMSGELDAYYRPTQYIVANPALKLNKTYTIGVDGVVILNDTNANSILNIIGAYAVLYTDTIISLNTASVLTRIPMLISASDDKTKDSADLFMQKILDGDFSVIGENAFFKGVTTHNTQSSNASQLTQLIELIQYYKASMYNELGLNANFNMKRERLNTSEVSMNIDVLLPYVDNMLVERQKALELINKMFDTNISVELASAWEITHEVADHDIETDDEHTSDVPDVTDEPDEIDVPDDDETDVPGDDETDVPDEIDDDEDKKEK